METMITTESIERKICIIRGMKVMLDSDLAELYAVSTKRLNEQVRRNSDRFPEDFMFQLTEEEMAALRCQTGTLEKGGVLRSQIATSRPRHGGRRYLPYVFTEHGALMGANILNV